MSEASRTFFNFVPTTTTKTSSRLLHKPTTHKPSSRNNNNNAIRCSISTSDSFKVTVNQNAITWGCEVDSVENASDLQKWLSVLASRRRKWRFRMLKLEWSCDEAGRVLMRYPVPDWPLLATYLISEASIMKKSKSRWSNYISALPRQPYSLLYWTCAELDRYLEASQIRERTIERITNVVGMYAFVLMLL